MVLTLSSAAAPDATLGELFQACARRGLTALELVDGHSHGLADHSDAPASAARISEGVAAGVEIRGLYRPWISTWHVSSAVSLAAELGAPLVIPSEVVETAFLSDLAAASRAAGARLYLTVRTDPARMAALRSVIDRSDFGDSLGLAWEVRPNEEESALFPLVLEAAGGDLRYVRLHGGGPESAEQTGRGVGPLMARLALARYAGPIVLTPSTSRYHQIWKAWLGRAGGWGCGSKQSDPSLITLDGRTALTGESHR